MISDKAQPKYSSKAAIVFHALRAARVSAPKTVYSPERRRDRRLCTHDAPRHCRPHASGAVRPPDRPLGQSGRRRRDADPGAESRACAARRRARYAHDELEWTKPLLAEAIAEVERSEGVRLSELEARLDTEIQSSP